MTRCTQPDTDSHHHDTNVLADQDNPPADRVGTMRTIYKYPLAIAARQTLRLPATRRLLDIQEQNGAPVAWYMVDTETQLEPVELAIYGTGFPIAEPVADLWPLRTVQIGGYVWHVFEVHP